MTDSVLIISMPKFSMEMWSDFGVVHVTVCTYIYTNVLTLDEGDPVADVGSVEGTDSTNSVGTQTDLSMRGIN